MDDATRAAVQEIAEAAAKSAVKQTLLTLGFNTQDVLQAQQDMAALRTIRDTLQSEEFRQDLLHLRKWRLTMESAQGKGVMGAMALMVFGGVAFILYAFKIKIFGI